MYPFPSALLTAGAGITDISRYDVLAYATSGSPSAAILLDSEAYDNGGWHSIASNTNRLAVPSGVSYARGIANERISSGTITSLSAQLNGASFKGRFIASRSDTPGADASNAATAIVAVSAGDYFNFTGDAAQSDTWCAAEAIPATRKMALVGKSGNQAISAATTTTLGWDTETRDTDNWHDSSTNNTRLTVPSGVSLARVSAFIRCDDGSPSTQFVISFLKNGASALGLPQQDQEQCQAIGAVSAILAVSAGDYFECRAFHTDAMNVLSDDGTWFQIEEIDSATLYALVNKSGTQLISAATFTAVTFGAETADTSGFHDNSTNNSRLTVPSGLGITQARLSFGIAGANVTGQLIGEVRKNGSPTPVPGLPRQETATDGTDSVNGFGAWVDVVAGDYFELYCYSDNSQTLPVSNNTWFCIETR